MTDDRLPKVVDVGIHPRMAGEDGHLRMEDVCHVPRQTAAELVGLDSRS